jgi:energy-coupling factor transporter ATP-binding protein EcfA2
MNSIKNMLTLTNVSFKFSPSAGYFFKDVSASFERGKLHIIRGKNGAGKSTFFRIVQGVLNQGEELSGTFCFGDECHDVSKDNKLYESFLHKSMLVPQVYDAMIADQFSFIENLRFANMSFIPGLSSLPQHKPLPPFIARFGIDFNKPLHLLSGGQRQILAILMLDDKNAEMVMQFLGELIATTGLTVLIICHDKELLVRYASGSYFEIITDESSGLRSVTVKQV